MGKVALELMSEGDFLNKYRSADRGGKWYLTILLKKKKGEKLIPESALYW